MSQFDAEDLMKKRNGYALIIARTVYLVGAMDSGVEERRLGDVAALRNNVRLLKGLLNVRRRAVTGAHRHSQEEKKMYSQKYRKKNYLRKCKRSKKSKTPKLVQRKSNKHQRKGKD